MTLDGQRVMAGFAGGCAGESGCALARHSNAITEALFRAGAGNPQPARPISSKPAPGYAGYKPRHSNEALWEDGRPGTQSQLRRSCSLPASRFPEHKIYESGYGRKPNPLPNGVFYTPQDAAVAAALDAEESSRMTTTRPVNLLDRRVSLMQGTERDPGFFCRAAVHRDFQEAFERRGKAALEVVLCAEALKPRRRNSDCCSRVRSCGMLQGGGDMRKTSRPASRCGGRPATSPSRRRPPSRQAGGMH